MGKLVDQPLRTLYQGISRQPDNTRLPGQVEEAVNALFSVVSGGFEKRMPLEFVSELAGLPTTGDHYIYMWKRDASEQYALVIFNGDLKVYDLLTGAEKTVTFPDGKTYLVNAVDPRNGFSSTTILDSTIIANKSIETAMDATVTATTINGPAKNFNDLPRSGETVQKYLSGYAAGSTWALADVTDGEIWEVNEGTSDVSKYFVQLTIETNDNWVWRETADPNHPNAFNKTTMPHRLDRQSDGTFIFQQVDYEDRGVGDPDIVPDPDFVGGKIADIAYWRERLTYISGETSYSSQSGDYFNFWPDEATQVADSDPFGRIAGTSEVNELAYAVPFHRSLFLTGESAQFELSSGNQDVLTPARALIDEATKYNVDISAKPLAFGDELYFAADAGAFASIFEYYYDETSLGNTATDSAKHAQGYIVGPIKGITGDTTTQTLFVQGTTNTNELYIYRTYWDGNERKQRAWSRYAFSGITTVLGMKYLDGYLYIIGRASDDKTYLVRHEIEYKPGPLSHPSAVMLDMRWYGTGTYDAPSDTTTWTLPFPHTDDIVAVLSSDFGDGQTGRIISASTSGDYTVTLSGDYSAGNVVFGRPYETRVQLSKQYIRSQQSDSGTGTTVTSGRLQLRTMSFDFENTGYFEVQVTPEARPVKTKTFTGRQLGSSLDLLGGSIPIVSDGTFTVPIRSRGDTVKIEVVSSEPIPFRITTIRWVGMFNEITRQE